MKTKCSLILKSTIAMVLAFLMLFGTMSTSLAAVVDKAETGYTSMNGKIYFDNSKTQWSAVYLYVGHASYAKSYQMTNTTYNDIWVYDFTDTFTDRTKLYFANHGDSPSGQNYSIDAQYGWNTNNNTRTALTAASNSDAGSLFSPSSAAAGTLTRTTASYVVSGEIASNGWDNTTDIMTGSGTSWTKTYNNVSAGNYTFAVVGFANWNTSYRWAARGTLTANSAGSWADAGDGDRNIKLTLTAACNVTITLTSANKVDVTLTPLSITYTGISANAKYSTDGSSYGTTLSGANATVSATSYTTNSAALTLSAAEVSGYTFYEWYSANGTISNKASRTGATFTPSANNATATARYKKNYTIQNNTTDTNGTVTISNTSPVAGGSYTVTVAPKTGYKLSSLTVGGSNVTSGVSNNQYNGTASGTNGTISVVATFTALPVTTIYIKKGIKLGSTAMTHAYIWTGGNEWTGSWAGENFTQWSQTADGNYYYKAFTEDESTFQIIISDGQKDNAVQTDPSAAAATGQAYRIDSGTSGQATPLTTGAPTPTYTVTLNKDTGIKSVKYKIDNGTAQAYSAAITVEKGSVVTFSDVVYNTGHTFDSVTGATASADKTTFTTAAITANTTVTLKSKTVAANYISFHTTHNADGYVIAACPRRVVIGDRTYNYSSKDTVPKGPDHIISSSGTYGDGNLLVAYPGEKITITYPGLSYSDAVSAIFFNNSATDENYTRSYAVDGALYADANYYDDDAISAVIAANKNSYKVNTVNQNTHSYSWIVDADYKNIVVEVASKYQLIFNDNNTDGLTISNIHEEGYYGAKETIGSSTDHTNGLKITIDNSDTTRKYSFNGTTAVVKDADGNTVTGVTVKAYTSSNATATNAASVDHFLVSGTMPDRNVYITIPVKEQYRMRLANIVASDAIGNKTMLTETNGSTNTSTGNIGTITAVPKTNGVNGSDISSEGTTNYYTYPGNNNSKEVNAYTSSNNNKYLKGGVNKTGSLVEAGSTVTYTFTFENGKNVDYTFIGWYEGKFDGSNKFTADYTKKLSSRTSFTYTPTKSTVVMAVAVRKMYLGGTFSENGAFSTTTTTWSSKRIAMSYDPAKDRYYYTFNTVTANSEYKYRVYDVSSGSSTPSDNELTVWNKWSNGNNGYNHDNDDDGIASYRDKYENSTTSHSHAGFMYANATGKKITTARANGGSEPSATTPVKVHSSNGYAAPVTVYFSTSGGTFVRSTYQYAMAYVSPGVGIENKNGTTAFNVPTVSVDTKTVNGKPVTVDEKKEKYGATVNDNGKLHVAYEVINECLVQEADGAIVVTARPNNANVELQAFVVYNIETKEAEAVTTFTKSGSGATASYTGNITIPQNSKIYVSPVYKYTDAYISQENIRSTTVYVSTEEIDVDTWGGLVAMYSWSNKTDNSGSADTNGVWPGQLLIPSDDGTSFYGELTAQKGMLSGVVINNYDDSWGGQPTNFIGDYKNKGVSDVQYSGSDDHFYQTYDYREPVTFLKNFEDGKYNYENVDLTFVLKDGDKKSAPATSDTEDNFNVGGKSDYSEAVSFEYLTDRSGEYRVDLNGQKIEGNPTATYKIVCNYTPYYRNTAPDDKKETYYPEDTVRNAYSIDWTVYNFDGTTKILDGKNMLSTTFAALEKQDDDSYLTYIANELSKLDRPVAGKSVMIAYENPGTWQSAIRYSGQWYLDGVNTLIDANVRVGVYSDGVFTPSDSNAPGYATATVAINNIDTTVGEGYKTEPGCSGNSLATVTKTHASENRGVTFTVSTTENFLGWYRSNGKGGYEPVGSGYKNKSITPSFNDDMTYYAFYNAQASYRFQYTDRFGNTKYYTAKGSDLTDGELANNGILEAEARNADIQDALINITGIKVFNRDLTYALTNADTSKPYTITFKAGESDAKYKLTVYSYNESGSLVKSGVAEGTWSTELDVTEEIGKGTPLILNKPKDMENKVFIGWKVKGDTNNAIISTQGNFGYSITKNTEIEPVFGDERITEETWRAGIDSNTVTQELTDAETGVIYNDSLISFRYAKDTGHRIDLSGNNDCGIVILAQTKDASENTTTADAFNALGAANLQSYVGHMNTHNLTSAKMNSMYGDSYAFCIHATELSRLNRADLFQIFDYSKFTGGNFKVMSYYYDGSKYVYSDVVEGTLTPTAK